MWIDDCCICGQECEDDHRRFLYQCNSYEYKIYRHRLPYGRCEILCEECAGLLADSKRSTAKLVDMRKKLKSLRQEHDKVWEKLKYLRNTEAIMSYHMEITEHCIQILEKTCSNTEGEEE